MTRVAIVGVGYTDFRSITPEVSWKEIMYKAASRAYDDAGINPRRDVKSFITCAEDYWEGFSIFDEFTPDQMGAVLRPMITTCGDGIHGLANAFMQIKTGLMDVVAVESHSKISDLITYRDVVLFAFDPVYNRPLGGHPYYVAGLEMRKYMEKTGTTEEDCAHVVVKNKKNAMKNPLAGHEGDLTVDQVMKSRYMFEPLKKLDIAPLSDGAIVLILASEEKAKELTDTPVWIKGVGWASDTPWLEQRDWSKAVYTELASKNAYKMAGISYPRKEIDFAEVDDKFSYKELQHVEACHLCPPGKAGRLVSEGYFERNGVLPVNVSGGSIGCGNLIEASGLQRTLEVVLQLKGEAGSRQLDGKTGLAASWRGVPTASGACIVLGV
ncbi:MAG: thiolase domain-containing protein [Theionarchaea archaeon]|nr:MAG: acetyl-CoA acetyltransferase [Theionarchaea archaeon DG-70-1]MBU7029790.1 thiolase domain-containing protein [Theionarchaea archaeon]